MLFAIIIRFYNYSGIIYVVLYARLLLYDITRNNLFFLIYNHYLCAS